MQLSTSQTIQSLQTPAGSTFDIVWSVRWTTLDAPTQRFTLMVWKAVRELEKRLNKEQPEPYVYVIPNDELLRGVNFIFNITAIDQGGETSAPKSFHIDNTQGEQKLDLVEGRAEQLYMVLVGGQLTYSDVPYVLQAQVTSCAPTQDYYFIWSVHDTISHESVIDVSSTIGSTLTIPPHSLRPGLEYDVNCQVIKQSTRLRITQTGLPFQVLQRGLKVYLSVDYLIIPVNQPFFIASKVINQDYYDSFVEFSWECLSAVTPCDFLEITSNDTLFFPDGIPTVGEYEIKLSVNVDDQSTESSAVIKTVDQTLPVLQITPISRVVNEGSKISLVANASNVAPACTLTWYFAKEGFVAVEVEGNGTCEDCQQGEALSDTLTIFSLEENFLNELADYTNETEWRQVTGEMPAAGGRARFIARCGCSLTFECETKGMVFADLTFVLNASPKPGGVKISPESGSAMETVFRISTLSVLDPETPLQYSFYCRVGDDEALLLGSFTEHLAVETFLPFIVGGTEIWVEVCDSLGACSTGEPTTVLLSPGHGSTIDMLSEDARGFIRRCELKQLQTVTIGAIVTYMNAEQPDLLSRFSTATLGALPPPASCLQQYAEQYTSLLHSLATHGVDTSALMGSS
ncbi:uncharacterized protein LOC126374919 isoform X2 [Pectinophora gossypiella]|uniref:uncharacterized protein LOC126374919 isoform X2 n=1 Tax=Pectinophora gossypiella TaxID=13191 RepID=UPI00214E8FA9|nr:uncharacterized protein LOC126374919 isoform X2 [Pectinophora gossypiella]